MAQAGASAPARLGRYELLARLATGGMGEIFLARLEGAAGFEKLCVVKRILPHLADDARFRQMLIAEAQIAAKMAHANICQVYELGETAGQLYIVMEYLEGVTMLPLLRRASKANAPLDLGFIAGVIQQTTDALHYAHELKDRSGEPLGLIHRDVTPANIFLCDSGVTKVLDFGIAKARGASAKTEDGAVKGKYAYMAPEQLRGTSIDRRVDLFALGVVLYETVALRRLFQRKTDYLTFRAVMEQPIPDIRRYRPDAPDALVAVIARALDRDPANRFDTARQLGSAVLDSIGRRPWSQGELGDFVKANFADELAQRAAQVGAAIGRNSREQRMTMPLITHNAADDDDTDDDFPPVETDINAPPLGASDAFVQSTPPPFSSVGETTGSAPELAPLRQVAPSAPIAARRSVLWPLLAVVAVLVAAGALFLVWHQMQQQVLQQQPAVINVTQSPANVISPNPPAPPERRDEPVPPPTQTTPTHPHPQAPRTYDQALAVQKSALTQCLVDHPDAVAGEAITATIDIAPNGHAQAVQLKPDTLNAAPLGGCLRNVLIATPFPSAAKANVITVPLKPKT
ncbi:MAG TPA: serine/threonine-protein kinase [Kofleriaceae bacterium]|jgi:serine/threonine-protein kinase